MSAKQGWSLESVSYHIYYNVRKRELCIIRHVAEGDAAEGFAPIDGLLRLDGFPTYGKALATLKSIQPSEELL